MAKMRVFELARELNVPGKDLITRIKTMGFAVDGNFNVLDEETIEAIKSKMLQPVTRVEEKKAPRAAEGTAAAESPVDGTGAAAGVGDKNGDGEAAGEEEPAERPRRRRIISARRSEEVQKIQESLGQTGPLPEDAETREEVSRQAETPPETQAAAPEEAEAPPPPEEETDEVKEARTRARQAEAAAKEAEEAAQAAAAAAAAEEPAQDETAAPPPDQAADTALAAATEDDEEEARKKRPSGEKDRVRWRELQEPGVEPDADDLLQTDPAHWRDGVRPTTTTTPASPPQQNYGREWLRPTRSRRGGERGRGRTARKSAGRDPDQKHVFSPRKKKIRIGQNITVSNLAGALGVKARDIIRKLMALGVIAGINEPVEGTTAELIAAEFNIEVDVDTSNLEDMAKEEVVDSSQLMPRPPIVTIMGHVDHGKTSLLDHIRSSHIADKESGGITQHIGAYHVKDEAGDIVFLDTPGHEAFSKMRARGADITDIVVLVVAADDGVMPQTVEAIEHARAAKVPILVAANKMDRPGADLDKIKRQLMEHNLLAEEFGGETVVVPVSAASGEGIPSLLEMIHLQAEIMELRAAREGRARGFVVESKMDRRRGPMATVIVQRGMLAVGDHFIAGTTFGRVRAMFDDLGEATESAAPSIPVEIIGFSELPQAGDQIVVMADEKSARQLAETRVTKKQETNAGQARRMHLEDFIQGIGQEEMTLLNIVLKGDTQGSIEALRGQLEKQGNENCRVEIVRAGVGGISETDIALAATTNSVVVGFNVRADNKAEMQAQAEGVEVKLYTVIYDLVGQVREVLQGMLKPLVREEITGHCEVRDVFAVSKEGQIAGGFIQDGKLERNGLVRLYRDSVLIHSGTIGSLRRFKEDVQNVSSGFECGLRIANYNDIRVGDLLETYVKIEEPQVLDEAGRG